MAYLAARTCIHINGVSRLHGEVSREHVRSQCIHAFRSARCRSATSPTACTWRRGTRRPPMPLWTRACGKARWMGTTEAHAQALAALDDEALWHCHGAGVPTGALRAAPPRGAARPARRGRADDCACQRCSRPERAHARLRAALHRIQAAPPAAARSRAAGAPARNPERPVQIIVAGKAHPHDSVGKDFVRQWAEFARRADVRAQAVFLEDYDMTLAQMLVQGVDVWINTPRRLWEACGTSGMKVLVNGGLNLLVARRLVGRGLCARCRLGDRQRQHRRRDRRGNALPPTRARGDPGVLRSRCDRRGAGLGRAHPRQHGATRAAVLEQSHAIRVCAGRATNPRRGCSASAPRRVERSR